MSRKKATYNTLVYLNDIEQTADRLECRRRRGWSIKINGNKYANTQEKTNGN